MVLIRTEQLLLSSESVVVRQKVAQVLECMRDELDDHRLAINENTAEQASAYEALAELNRRMDVLQERIDELALLVKGEPVELSFKVEPLSQKEKEVFSVLYNVTESQPYASYEQLARKCLLSKEQVAAALTSMVQKGVPIVKKHDGNVVFVTLDLVFRQVQAKKNLVGLDAPLTCWIR